MTHRFRDIPQVPKAGYRINVAFDYLETHVQRMTEEYQLNLDADFQRAHVWTTQQQVAFVEFLLQGNEGQNIIYCNHPNWMGSTQGQMVVVDGKQRLTACLAFLRNQIPAFGTYRMEYEDHLPTMNGLVWAVAALKTQSEVLRWYLAINAGGTPHTSEELKRVRLMLQQEEEK